MNRIGGYLRSHWYLPLSILLALIGIAMRMPQGEDIVGLGWDVFFTFPLIYVSYAGLRREKAFSLMRSFLSMIRFSYAVLLFIGLFSYALGALITSYAAVLVMVPMAISTLKGAERERYIPSTVALVVLSASLGSMLLPSGSLANLYIAPRLGEAGTMIMTMLPLSLAGLAFVLILPLAVLGRDVRDEIFLHDEIDTEGSKSMRMLYVCMMIIAVLTAAGTFFWMDIFILFMAVLLIFDRKALLSVNWAIPASFMLLSLFASSIDLDTVGMASEIGITEIIGSTLSSLLLLPSSDPARLLRSVNIGSLGLMTSMAAFPAFMMMGKERGRFAIRYLLMSLPVAAALALIALSI